MNTPLLINSAIVGGLTLVTKPGILLPNFVLGLSDPLSHAIMLGGVMYLAGPTLMSYGYSLSARAPNSQKIVNSVTGINGVAAATRTEQPPPVEPLPLVN